VTIEERKAPGMSNRKCYRCVYAATDLSHAMNSLSLGWPATLACVNCASSPGRPTHVTPSGACRNFRPRREPASRIEPPPPPNDRIRYIALTHNLFAAVDARDYERLNKYRWYASFSGRGKVYARRNTKHGTVFMHREIMKTPPGMVVDHKDGNSLNNFRENMRNCAPEQNEYNKGPRGRKSRFKGVYPHGDKWQAKLKHKGKTY